MKLSIITVNLNNRDGLQKTIDSVVSQTFRDFEWIVIDGGSTDGSKELIEQYADHFAYWVSEPDKGVYNAMNKGIRVARGEYINFMNSGDCFAFASILSEIFSVPRDADVLYGNMARKSIEGELNNPEMMKPRLKWYDFYFSTINHQSSFTKVKLFEKDGCFDESYKILADWHFFAKEIAINRCSYEFIPSIVSVYEGGGISENSDNWKVDLWRLRKELYPHNTMERCFRYMTDYDELIHPYLLSRLFYKVLKYTMRFYARVFK